MKKGKYDKSTTLEELIKDKRVKDILNELCPSLFYHPRFNEAFECTLDDVVKMNLGEVAGIPKQHIKVIVRRILELE